MAGLTLAAAGLAAGRGWAADGGDAGTGHSLALRAADAILADAIAATGGDEPWKAHRSLEVTTSIEYRKMAMSATRTQISTSKNKSLAVTTIPNVGTVNEGTNGKVAWSQDPVNGLRILKGAEAAQARLESTWNLDRHLREMFSKIEPVIEKDEAGDGRALECLTLTPKTKKQGHALTNCYDPVTHLQVLQRGTASTPQGDVPFSSRMKEWKDVAGMKVPSLIEMSTGPIELIARVTEVTFDKPVDESIFEVPAARKTAGTSKAKGKAEPKGDTAAQ